MKFQKTNPPVFLVQLTSFCIAVGTIAFSPEVLAQSLSVGDRNGKFLGQSLPSLKSKLDVIPHWLSSFNRDGKNGADGNTGTGTYASNDLDFSGEGRPGSRTGQGSRGNCPKVDVSLTALIPESNLGRTVDGHPTFWFYIPYGIQNVSRANFKLLDKDQNPVWAAPISIPLSGTPGLISVTLPEIEQELEVNQEYHWYFTLECDANEPSNNPYVHGWVQRVAPIPGIESDDYLAYAEQGIWYNALTPLARMHQQDAQNPTFQKDWEDLLKAVGLDTFTEMSIVDCCEAVESANGI